MKGFNILLLSLLILPIFGISQAYKPGKSGGLYNTGKDNIDKGWYFGLGGTFMLGYLTEKASLSDTINSAIRNDFKGDPCGSIGPYAEIGLFRMNDRKVINYMDYGVAYKWFRGGEDYTDELFINDVLTSTITAEGRYSDHLISGHFNIGNRFDKSDDMFYVNGLGANFDYAIITSRSETPPIPTLEFVDGPGYMFGEIHYFFGMGFKTGKRLIIMPIVETPIVALLPFNHIISTHDYFNSRARRIVFRVRFMFLKKGSKSCPKVYNPMGVDPNNNGGK